MCEIGRKIRSASVFWKMNCATIIQCIYFCQIFFRLAYLWWKKVAILGVHWLRWSSITLNSGQEWRGMAWSPFTAFFGNPQVFFIMGFKKIDSWFTPRQKLHTTNKKTVFLQWTFTVSATDRIGILKSNNLNNYYWNIMHPFNLFCLCKFVIRIVEFCMKAFLLEPRSIWQYIINLSKIYWRFHYNFKCLPCGIAFKLLFKHFQFYFLNDTPFRTLLHF